MNYFIYANAAAFFINVATISMRSSTAYEERHAPSAHSVESDANGMNITIAINRSEEY
mgnify:CR=1 FL=1